MVLVLQVKDLKLNINYTIELKTCLDLRNAYRRNGEEAEKFISQYQKKYRESVIKKKKHKHCEIASIKRRKRNFFVSK